MNKHKKQYQGLRIPEIIILSVAGLILMTAGVGHAWLKNSQVMVVREMDSTQRRIQDQEGVINSLQVKIDKKLNIYQLRDDLKQAGSELVLVPVSAIEKIPLESGVGALASSDPSDSSLAQRSP